MTSHKRNNAALDPEDWADFRRTAHAILDDAISYVEHIRNRAVWRKAPIASRERFAKPLPVAPSKLDDVLDDVRNHVVDYATGNVHPRFMGWVHGAGTPVGIVADMLAAALDMNCGGRNHIGLDVERQIAHWMQEALGYPDTASGLFLTGSSMANFLAVIVAKVAVLGAETRQIGIKASTSTLVAYTSSEAHVCIAQALELSGIGSKNLRCVPVDSDGRMNVERLQAAIAIDRASGFLPFLVAASAGTVNTGAMDPLNEIADIAKREQVWFHVDGAIGALLSFSPALRPLLNGIERSDSVALDFHKWGHVPYDAGFLLVRDGNKHKSAFASPAAYLQRAGRGLAAGETWPCDLGPDLSRGFRALKTWMTIETFGTEKIGDAILHNCELARYFAEKIERSQVFVLKAKVTLNIVCFGLRECNDSNDNRELVLDLQESGIAAPSWTTLGGETVIRCAIVNHRTTRGDIDIVFDALCEFAAKRKTLREASSVC
ncbi:pyridoxal phosphate-dependent decarboxylase family protein [Hyphomicrobium sp.]|uniref:pyridoxal phosphate-dependent decarboxylase family protein n=1 Tax=Hyphomicrobium sp. TaxID=82 RepID=UPI002CEE9A9C|nr:aminotransferase class V-fold PLP-dependent enzyme [Hyphomicrobium sp.]HVZ04827.1 aminotransferase class V-fold PLP-dependent enzyme [Hyphomicrobium sp.]